MIKQTRKSIEDKSTKSLCEYINLHNTQLLEFTYISRPITVYPVCEFNFLFHLVSILFQSPLLHKLTVYHLCGYMNPLLNILNLKTMEEVFASTII